MRCRGGRQGTALAFRHAPRPGPAPMPPARQPKSPFAHVNCSPDRCTPLIASKPFSFLPFCTAASSCGKQSRRRAARGRACGKPAGSWERPPTQRARPSRHGGALTQPAAGGRAGQRANIQGRLNCRRAPARGRGSAHRQHGLLRLLGVQVWILVMERLLGHLVVRKNITTATKGKSEPQGLLGTFVGQANNSTHEREQRAPEERPNGWCGVPACAPACPSQL